MADKTKRPKFILTEIMNMISVVMGRGGEFCRVITRAKTRGGQT